MSRGQSSLTFSLYCTLLRLALGKERQPVIRITLFRASPEATAVLVLSESIVCRPICAVKSETFHGYSSVDNISSLSTFLSWRPLSSLTEEAFRLRCKYRPSR